MTRTSTPIPIKAGARPSYCAGPNCRAKMYWAEHPTTKKLHPVSVNTTLLPEAKEPTAEEARARDQPLRGLRRSPELPAAGETMTAPALRDSYEAFLDEKLVTAPPLGYDGAIDVAPHLFPFQRDIVRWALRRGRAAIFAECGLGKTPMQLEWARHVAERSGPVLILTPLAVSAQTVAEAVKFGVHAAYARTQSAIAAEITVTNYERLELFDPASFAGIVLDESSILKAYMGVTKRALVDAFAATPFRLCCTATPAPNDHVELGNHAEFLSVLSSSQMLARWFINDTTKSGVYRLKRHAEADFWRWVATWAVCVSKPSDLRDADGRPYSDDGFVLPPLEIHEHTVAVDHLAAQASTGELFRHGSLSATELHGEMRDTCSDRARRVAELVNADTSGEPWVIWCNTNYEADAVSALFPDAVEVRGNMTPDEKERRLTDFAEGRTRLLITKPSIAGYGMNWQHCARMAFVGLSYSYEQLYQALRRSWRFGQVRPVGAHLVVAESEGAVRTAIRRKQGEHEEMQRAMVEAMRDVQCQEPIAETTPLRSTVERGQNWELYLGDCVDVVGSLAKDSVHFSVFSPPFSNIYIYSDHPRDMGNTVDDAEFFRHLDFLVPELWRVTVPGRLAAIHCKNLPMYAGRDGRAGLRDFRGEIIRAFEAHGWVFHSEVTIWKSPVTEMQRTKAHGLLYRTLRTDATFCRQGLADYLVIVRKWADADARAGVAKVVHDEESFPLAQWQRYASPVWMDIDPTDVLNVEIARDDKDEKHLCPLQLEVIRRAVTLWSNPGETVLSPFAGIGSEGVVSLELGRRFIGVELKESYWHHAVRHLREAEAGDTLDLFAQEDVA